MNTYTLRTRLACALALGLTTAALTSCGGGGSNLRADRPVITPAAKPPPTDAIVYGAGFNYIDKPITGDLHIQPAAAAGLDANVAGSVNNEGTMIVWNPSHSESNSHVRIGGNYQQGSGATLVVHLGGIEASDLRIAGNAALGGTLQIAMPCCGIGDMYTNSNYSLTPTILHADGSVSGAFDQVILPSVFVSGAMNYGAHDITLNLMQASAASVAGSMADSVTQAGAATLDAVIGRVGWQVQASASPSQNQLAGSMETLWHIGDATQAARSFDSLTGHAYASVQAWMLDPSDSMDLRVALQPRQPGDGGAWLRNTSSLAAHADAGSMAAGVRREGSHSGLDHWFGSHLLVGVASGREEADAQFERSSDRAHWRLPSTTAYAHYRQGYWYATGVLSQSQVRLDMQRWIDLGQGLHRAGGELALDRFQGVIETGREFRLGGGVLTPYAGLSHTSARNQAFMEQGDSGFELSILPTTQTRSVADIGLRYARAWHWNGDGWANLRLDGTLGQQLNAGAPLMASYVGLPDLQFALPNVANARQTQRLDLQFELGRSRNASWSAFVHGGWVRNGNHNDQAWQLGAQRRF